MNFHFPPTTSSSSSNCTNITMSTKLHQPSTSTQPTLRMDVQETFSDFTLNGSDISPTTPTRFNQLSVFNIDNDEEGYSTPTGDITFVPEESWVYSTPTKARREPICPGAPKRKNTNDSFSSSHISFSQSLPSESLISPKRGITKQKKYRKTSPPAFVRRRSFPNIRLDFSDIDVSDEGQNTN